MNNDAGRRKRDLLLESTCEAKDRIESRESMKAWINVFRNSQFFIQKHEHNQIEVLKI